MRQHLKAMQADLFNAVVPTAPDLPDGFAYAQGLVSDDEAAALIARIETLPFRPFEFRGYLGHREVVNFGWRYDYTARRVREASPLPGWLEPLRAVAADFAGLEPARLQQTLVTRYVAGATIGWHRDKPHFDRVIGVSLGAPAVMRFRRGREGGWERRSATVEPGSIYLLDGPARHDWEHSLRPVEALRYSVTFRSVAKMQRAGT